jgi:hypothetical protein
MKAVLFILGVLVVGLSACSAPADNKSILDDIKALKSQMVAVNKTANDALVAATKPVTPLPTVSLKDFADLKAKVDGQSGMIAINTKTVNDMATLYNPKSLQPDQVTNLNNQIAALQGSITRMQGENVTLRADNDLIRSRLAYLESRVK